MIFEAEPPSSRNQGTKEPRNQRTKGSGWDNPASIKLINQITFNQPTHSQINQSTNQSINHLYPLLTAPGPLALLPALLGANGTIQGVPGSTLGAPGGTEGAPGGPYGVPGVLLP